MRRIYPLPKVGDKIGDMIVESLYHDEAKKVRVKMKCTICGRITDADFRSGVVTGTRTKHSQCDKSRNKGKSLADANPRFYNMWQSMRRRTNGKNNVHYEYYGGRGISSDAFDNFVDFYDIMYEQYLEAIKKYGNEKIVSLDRIDPDKDYCPENCRFISLEEQEKNKRRNRWFLVTTPDGKEITSCSKAEFARCYPINRLTLTNCLNNGVKNRKGWKARYLTEEEIEDRGLTDRLQSIVV